jgi:hypothetical protein
MTIAYAIELILELAVAMGATRYWYDHTRNPWLWNVRFSLVRGEDWIVASFVLSALSVAGAVGLAVELARGRSPGQWGPGRWVWSLAGTFTLLTGLYSGMLLYPDGGLLRLSRLSSSSWSNFAPVLVSLWVTARTAKVTLGETIDGRERSGRILALVIIAQWLIELAQHAWLIFAD